MVEIFLPLARQDGTPQPADCFTQTRSELVEHCGGVTIYARAPAEGLWRDGTEVVADQVVVFEALDRAYEAEWWQAYKRRLCERFEQDEVMVRVIRARLV